MPGYLGYVAALAVAFLLANLLIGRRLGASVAALSCNLLFGYGAMAAANVVLPAVGYAIPINAVTLLCAGWLGLPGTVLAAALQVF